MATDADPAGDKAYTAIREGLPGVEILRVRPPDGHDINERYVSDPEALIHALNGTAATVTG